jgi:RNA polymerase sigma-70 factor, ECF subfamily
MPTLEATRGGATRAASERAGTWERRTSRLEPRLEQHRRELTHYCRRALGSAFEAEDAVQETLVRAWRNLDRFEGRATLRSWLYRIASNVCTDMMRRPQRRARPLGLGPLACDEVRHSTALTPGGGAARAVDDPADMAAARERILLAFLVLQQLPPRQRAVVILRDVLRWRAEEVAELLGSTVTSVNSALQRARSALAAADLASGDRRDAIDAARRQRLEACVDAFGQVDVDSLMASLHDDTSDSGGGRRARRPRIVRHTPTND